MHQSFSVPIDVRGLPVQGGFMPVSHLIHWDEILEQCAVAGVVDEHTLRLYRCEASGGEVELPLQYRASAQSCSHGRPLREETPSHVSWAANWSADSVSPSAKGSGTVTWIAQGDLHGGCRYRLSWRVPAEGHVVQVPYPPHNLRCFDAEGQPTRVRWFPSMQLRPLWPLDGVIHVSHRESLRTSYHLGPTAPAPPDEASDAQESGRTTSDAVPRRPYFYPVHGPDGIGLTELGKPHDPTGSHAHHYSLWMAHANVNGHDFWSEKGGCVRHQQFDEMEDGPLYARLVQQLRWDRGAESQMQERRELTLFVGSDDIRVIDFDSEFSSVGSEPVELGQTPFGFLAARVSQCMTVFDGSGEIINSNGERNEDGACGQRAAWIDQSGPIAPQKWGGVTLLDHPSNPHFPTHWHCRNDGWAGASFNREAPWHIQDGEVLRLRYRVVLHRHNALESGADLRYDEYACIPTISLGAPQRDDLQR